MAEIIKNKKAFFDYEIIERIEAGIELAGSEVKALRAKKVSIKESFIRIVKNQAVLFGMHISRLSTTQNEFAPEEKRARNLLLHKKELTKLHKRVKLEKLAIIPLRLYFNSRNICKVEIALARGKKLHDKRESIKKREDERNAKRSLKSALSNMH